MEKLFDFEFQNSFWISRPVAFTHNALKSVDQSMYPLQRKSKYFGWNPKWYTSCRFRKKMEIRMPIFSFQPNYLFTHHLSKQRPPQRLFQLAVYFDERFEITDVFSPLKPNGTVSLPLGFPSNLSYEPQPVSRPCATVKIPPPSLAERSESFKCR